MRTRDIILLAVCSNITAAGPLRQHGSLAQHKHFPRYNNISSLPSTSAEAQTSVSKPLPSTVPNLPREGESAAGKPSTALTTGSLQSPMASLSTSSGTVLPASGRTSTISMPQTTASPLQSTTSAMSTVPSGTASTLPTNTQLSANFKSQSTPSVASPLASTSAAVELVAPNPGAFASVTAASSSVISKPSGIQYPSADQGNIPMATGFNTIFKKMEVTSTCNPNDSNQAVACISGELAQCQGDGTYVLKSCPQGQSCYALPKPSGGTGISVECAIPSDAVVKLSAQQNAGNNPIALSPTASTHQTSGTIATQDTPSPKSSGTQSLSSQSTIISSQASPLQSQSPQSSIVQSPVQPLFSISQTTAVPGTHSGISVTSTPASNSIIASTSSTQAQPQSNAPAIPSASQSSSISQSQPAQRPAQTLQSFPPASASVNPQSSAAPAGRKTDSPPAQSQSMQAAPNSVTSHTASATPTTATDDSGPLFTIPDAQPSSTPTSQPHKEQHQDNNDAPQKTSAAPSQPSALAQQQPAGQSSASPAAHIPSAVPAKAQATASQGANAPKSKPDDQGITIVPLGGDSDSSKPPVANQKLAAVHSVSAPVATPIASSSSPNYITVTVTTTAYTQAPSP